jgi:hypothetical protein
MWSIGEFVPDEPPPGPQFWGSRILRSLFFDRGVCP